MPQRTRDDAIDELPHFLFVILRCMLKPQALYYAYLLPLGLIMVHNVVVFAMVIRVLMSQGHTQADQKGTAYRMHSFLTP